MEAAGVLRRGTYNGPRPIPDMTGDFSLWKSQICQAVRGLCDIDFQPSTSWREAIANGSNFQQALQRLYVDSHFTEFLSWQAWRQAGLSTEAGTELLTLQQLLDAYDEPATDAGILLDPNWWVILSQAKKVIFLLLPKSPVK